MSCSNYIFSSLNPSCDCLKVHLKTDQSVHKAQTQGVYIHGLQGFKCPFGLLYSSLSSAALGSRLPSVWRVWCSPKLQSHRSINRRAFCARWLEKHLSSAYLRVILYNSYQGLLMVNPSSIVCRLLAVSEEGIPQLHDTSKCTTSQPPVISMSPPIWSKLAFFQTTQSLLATPPACNNEIQD